MTDARPQADFLFGLRVMQSVHAVTVEWYIARHPTRKRRRGYRPEKRTVPAMFKLGDHSLVVHPSIMPKLMEAARV